MFAYYSFNVQAPNITEMSLLLSGDKCEMEMIHFDD